VNTTPSAVERAATTEQSLAKWLEAAVQPDGLWPAWIDGRTPAFAYEEATAWVLRLAHRHPSQVARVAGLGEAVDAGRRELERRIARHHGLRAHGRLFLFDTAVGLSAFARGGLANDLLATVERLVRERRALDGGAESKEIRPESRWSEVFGAHLLWLNEPLRLHGAHVLADDLTTALLRDTRRPDGLFRIHAASDRVYLHALAYALEGLSHAGPDGRRLVKEALTTLERRHLLGHPLPAWLEEPSPARADATAQVSGIAREFGLDTGPVASLLDRFRLREGGLAYEPGSTHANTCAAVFALETAWS